ncbi:MAG: esterase-like activity of phytase family protein [Sphingorhabdus sp.]
MAGAMIAKLFRILLLSLLTILAVGGVRIIYENHEQSIALKPLQLDPAHPGIRRVGDLIFLAAWELGSGNGDFAGISALTALPDGRFVGVSDAGTLIGFGLTNDDRTDRPFIAPLPEGFGPKKLTFRDRDTEGITHDPGSGQFWVSYEANHAIRRFSPSFSRSTGMIKLTAGYHWPSNKGVEAIVRLPDGRFITIAENLEEGKHEGFLFSGDPVEPGTTMSHFDYRPPEGYRVTDGSMLPDGRLLILHRRIGFPEGFSAKLAVVDIGELSDRVTLEGKVIATLASPLLIDNMEGVTVTPEGQDTIIWLISDNNFNIWQRTLLMKFKLAERAGNKKPEAEAAPGFDSL